MNRTLSHIIFLLLTLCMVGCQNIPENERLVPLDWNNVPKKRNVLLVEFTGFRCVNCPTAAERAHHLLEVCPDNLVVVAMHPASNSFTKFGSRTEYDYTCPESDIYYKMCGGQSTTGFPIGTVNFSAEGGNGALLDQTSWSNAILRDVKRDPYVDISLQATLQDGVVSGTVALEPIPGTYVGEADVLVWVVEDNVLGRQSMPDGSVNEEYIHNHILRGELLSDDADGMGQYTILENERQSFDFSTPLPATVRDPRNCSLVAVVMYADIRVVLNVTKIKL